MFENFTTVQTRLLKSALIHFIGDLYNELHGMRLNSFIVESESEKD